MGIMAVVGRGGLKSMITAALCKGVIEAQSKIFGNVLNPNAERSSHKILRKKLIGHKVARYYPFDLKFDDPNYIAHVNKERLAKLEMKKRRGKGPPKKGQGRRASKRK